MKRGSIPVPVEYQPLHKYLDNRYADTVVLTFNEIEDLLGAKLPDPASRQPEWWASDGDGDAASPQSLSWTQACRTAEPNLRARSVRFERFSI
jgi:hypothetical protein